VNGCFGYDRNSNQLNQCDGRAAADMFCREKHFGFARNYQVSTRGLGTIAGWGGSYILPDLHALTCHEKLRLAFCPLSYGLVFDAGCMLVAPPLLESIVS
jgi:hypothetical protein